MLVTMLPAQFVSAAGIADLEPNVIYADSAANIPTTYNGNYLKLDKATGTGLAYDYTLTMGIYNVKKINKFESGISFDNTKINLCDSKGYNFETTYDINDTQSPWYSTGKATADLTTNTDLLNGRGGAVSLVGTLLDTPVAKFERSDTTDSVRMMSVMYSQVNLSTWKTNWTNSNTKAVAEGLTTNIGEWAIYTSPENKPVEMYTWYFKLTDAAKTAIDAINGDAAKLAAVSRYFSTYTNTITPQYTGGCTNTVTTTAQEDYLTNGVCYVGFAHEAESKEVKFTKVQSSGGSALNAKIFFYTDSEMTKPASTASVSTTDGAATVSLPGGGTPYWYKIVADGYQDKIGTFTVGETTVTVEAADTTLKSNSEVTYSTTITVTNADTDEAIEGAKIYLDSASTAAGQTAAATGQFNTDLTAAEHGIKVECEGFQTVSKNYTIKSSGGNNIPIELVPNRVSYTVPNVAGRKGEQGNLTVSGGMITLKRISETPRTDAWDKGGESVPYTPGTTQNIPANTTFSVEATALGCTSEKFYMKTGAVGTEPTYYSDEACTNPKTLTGSVELTLLSDPYYEVNIETGADNKTYTATVKLHNIAKAAAGAFGLQYDKNIFDFKTCVLNDELVKLHDATGEMPTQSQSAPSEKLGYNVFTWQGKTVDLESGYGYVDASSPAGVLIATYTFEMKSGKSANDITSNAFTVMPYDKTADGAKIWSTSADAEEVHEVLDPLWRYCDEQNNPSSPAEGRLSKNDATLSGFYQVFVFSDDTYTTATTTYDVATKITTDFTAAKGCLSFVVTDKETGAPLSDATVNIYDNDDAFLTTLTTDTSGMINYTVPGTSDATFKYSVSRPGYWSQPEDAADPLKTATVAAKTTVNENIEMEKKLYHDVKLYDINNAAIADTDMVLTNDTAYNGRTFNFSIKAAPGKKLTKRVKNMNLQIALDGITYTAKAEYDKTTDTMKIDGTKITGAIKNENETPDPVKGYQSNEIKIKINEDLPVTNDDTTYSVTAQAGDNGYVTYTATEGTQLPATTETPRTGEGKTGNSSVEIGEISPTETKPMGTLTFTADNGFEVERVYINGADISNVYKGRKTFDYTFTNLKQDNNITVTFYDGMTPSNDKVMTLAVGSNGKATVNSVDYTNTTMTWLNPTADLTFTVAPDDGYKLDKVEKKVDSAEKINITNETESNLNYTVAMPQDAEKDIKVFVSFKDEEATESTNVTVTSYVESGEGTVSPAGVYVVNKTSNFPVIMSPASADTSTNHNDWSITAAKINGTNYAITADNKKAPYTYTVQNIMEDTSIGAVFTEATYTVIGHVDLSQASPTLSTLDARTGAKVVCQRINESGAVDMTTTPVFTTTTRADAVFTVELAKGTWNITVSKRGYVNYTITGYTVGDDANTTLYFGSPDNTADNCKKITPYIGNTTGTGKSVSLYDFGVISNGLRSGAHADIKDKGDVNDDGSTDISDVSYEKLNYGRRTVTKSYTDFMEN